MTESTGTAEAKPQNITPEETQAQVAKKTKRAISEKAKSLSTLEVEYVAISDIKPNDYNPNRQDEHDFELLCGSMREDGFTQPVIARKETGVIVDGEHRWRAAQVVGIDPIPVVYVSMTDEQAKISTLRHNRARGSHDLELEAAVLRDLQELGALEWAQNSLMMDDLEIQRMLEDVSAPEALAAPEFQEAWEPDSVGNDDLRAVSQEDPEEVVETEGSGNTITIAATSSAADAIRAREKKIAEARTEEERSAIRRDTDVFHLRLIYRGEQGRLVKELLGRKPAVAIWNALLWLKQQHPDGDLPFSVDEEAKIPE